LIQNLGDDFLGNPLTQEPIYARSDLHVRDTQHLTVLVNDRLNVGRETRLIRQRERLGIHLHTLHRCGRGVTGTSFLVSSSRGFCSIDCANDIGVGDGDRTRDIRCHRPTLYQLSYAHQRLNRGQFTLKPASIEMGGNP
jgi:hypothetical protein